MTTWGPPEQCRADELNIGDLVHTMEGRWRVVQGVGTLDHEFELLIDSFGWQRTTPSTIMHRRQQVTE